MSEELTPLQQSAATTGRRFFRCSEVVYQALTAQIDAQRGYPLGENSPAVTVRGLPLAERCDRAANDDILISVETWRITEDDQAMLAGAIGAGHVTELTANESAEANVNIEDI